MISPRVAPLVSRWPRSLAPSAPPPTSVLGDEVDLGWWLHPVPVAGVFDDPDWCIWCGSVVRGDDGNYRLFYSRWPSRLGRLARVTHSEVARAACASTTGPYRHAGVVLPACGEKSRDGSCTRNPTIFRVGKKLCLYHMGNVGDGFVPAKRLKRIHRNHQRIGVATADSPAGPWTRFDHPAVDISADRDAPDALMTSNPATCVRPDGRLPMFHKVVATKCPAPFGGPVVRLVATADKPAGPWKKKSHADLHQNRQAFRLRRVRSSGTTATATAPSRRTTTAFSPASATPSRTSNRAMASTGSSQSIPSSPRARSRGTTAPAKKPTPSSVRLCSMGVESPWPFSARAPTPPAAPAASTSPFRRAARPKFPCQRNPAPPPVDQRVSFSAPPSSTTWTAGFGVIKTKFGFTF